MLNPMKKIKLLHIATKYGVQLIHHEQGYVHIRLSKWNEFEVLFRRILEDVKEQTFVKSVIIDDVRHTVSIYYDEHMMNNSHMADVLYEKLMSYF